MKRFNNYFGEAVRLVVPTQLARASVKGDFSERIAPQMDSVRKG